MDMEKAKRMFNETLRLYKSGEKRQAYFIFLNDDTADKVSFEKFENYFESLIKRIEEHNEMLDNNSKYRKID